MVVKIYLLRHGETEYNLSNHLVGGQSNWLKLTERGKMQAKALGNRLKSENISFDKFYSSTSERAIETAGIISEIIKYPKENIIAAKELLELSQGDWEGKERDKIYNSEILNKIKKEHWEFKAPNGESQKEVEERVYSWIKENILPLGEGTIGIVGHGMAIKCLLRKVLQSDPKLTYKFCINNCSISEISYILNGQHEGWSINRINDSAHLLDPGFAPTNFK